jgi:hypothetical protein
LRFGFNVCPSDVCSGNAWILSGVVFVRDMKRKGNREKGRKEGRKGVRKSNYFIQLLFQQNAHVFYY